MEILGLFLASKLVDFFCAELPDFVTKFVGLPGDIGSSLSGGMYIAFSEGWGLYSEFLGHDLGIYKDQPLKELGYVKGDILRSARLVVDVGLHKYGWSASNAVQFLMDNAGYSFDTATAQVERYITYPGQAVAYKVGEWEIQRLRQKYVQETSINLKEFHTFILKCLGPMDELESCVESRIEQLK